MYKMGKCIAYYILFLQLQDILSDEHNTVYLLDAFSLLSYDRMEFVAETFSRISTALCLSAMFA